MVFVQFMDTLFHFFQDFGALVANGSDFRAIVRLFGKSKETLVKTPLDFLESAKGLVVKSGFWPER